jgi:ketosteroid isomerase-like protein
MVEDSMHLNGNVAWEAVLETGQLKFKTGEVVKGDYLATNVFEKQSDGRWLMVSHHANPKPH